MAAIYIGSIFLQALLADSAPLTQNDSTAYLDWKAEPDGRGTFSILSSCSITMVLCVWTALHLNISPPSPIHNQKPGWKRHLESNSWRQARWILMGLLAPELVVYAAWMQQRLARRLCDQVWRRCEETDTPYDWSIYHSWYLLMGGFIFTTYTDREDSEFIPGSPDLILTPRGLRYLLDHDPPLIPFAIASEIRDFGKADSLAKLLACLQAAYLVSVCVSRLAYGIPVSQLEVNTCGHALCALMMYVFWFRKPKDVKTHIPITDPRGKKAAAVLYTLSGLQEGIPFMEISSYCDRATTFEDLPCRFIDAQTAPDEQKTRFLAVLARLNDVRKRLAAPIHDYMYRHPGYQLKEQLDGWKEPWKTLFRWLMDADSYNRAVSEDPFFSHLSRPRVGSRESMLDGTERQEAATPASQEGGPEVAPRETEKTSKEGMQDESHSLEELAKVYGIPTLPRLPDQCQVNRLHMLAASIEEIPRLFPTGANSEPSKEKGDLHYDLQCYNAGVEVEAKDWPSLETGYGPVPFGLQGLMALATVTYAGLHAAAWRSHFPSVVELYLWRTSLLVIGGSGVLFSLRVCLRHYDGCFAWNMSTPGVKSQRYYVQGLLFMFGLYQGLLSHDLPVLLIGPRKPSFWGRRSPSWLCGQHSAPHIVRALVAVFFICRGYIVIEAFISLRSVPPKMYDTPTWPNWIPHL